jgi:dethiobiotin synthetase
VEETRVPGENPDLSQVTDKLYHIILHRAYLASAGYELTALVAIGTTNENNYHDITEILLKVAFNTITILTQQNNTKWQIETLIQLPDSRYIIYATV